MLKIEVSVKTVKYAGEEKEESFLAYRGFTKKGWIELKFTKDVDNAPTKNGYIYVEKENLNVNRTGRFPVIWVKKIEKFEEITFAQKIEDYFDK